VLANLRVGGFLVPKAPTANVRSDERVTFAAANKVELTSGDPPVKAAFVILAQLAPLDLGFDALCQQVQPLIGASGPMSAEARQRLAGTLLQCYHADLLELHASPPPFVRDISERPKTTPLARRQAAASPLVTNLRHRLVELPPFDRALLMHLDGSHQRRDLLAPLAEDISTGKLQVAAKDGSRPAADAIPGILEKSIEPALRRIAVNSLLIG